MIPQIQPWINEDELNELKKVIDSTFITESTVTKEFENRIENFTGAKFAVAMCNGTAALFCCLKALGIGKGDEVIVPDITFIATANSVIMAGAKPIFCDVDPDTFCLDPAKIEGVINIHTKAIMPVHLYGQSADMEAILKIASDHKLYVIEDAAQGVGVKFMGKCTGTFGVMGVLSFYGNKVITTGEGGVVITNDEFLAKECYRLKNHGRDKKGVFIHEHLGFNFSFTEMQAALGIAQLKKFYRISERKKEINQKYNAELKNLDRFRSVFIDQRCEPVFWFTSFLCDDTEKLSEYLFEKGIQTRRFFYPLHLQPCYKNMFILEREFPISERIYKQGISLPSSYTLTDEEQNFIIASIKNFYSI